MQHIENVSTECALMVAHATRCAVVHGDVGVVYSGVETCRTLNCTENAADAAGCWLLSHKHSSAPCTAHDRLQQASVSCAAS